MSQHAVAPEPDLSFPKGLAFETWATLTMPGDTPMTLSATNANRQASLIPSRFTGKERDAESGNDYFGARYYSSNDARFLTPDWAAKVTPVPYAKLDNPQSLNLYSYVWNNPLRSSDPDGHDICTQDQTGKTIGCQKQSKWHNFWYGNTYLLKADNGQTYKLDEQLKQLPKGQEYSIMTEAQTKQALNDMAMSHVGEPGAPSPSLHQAYDISLTTYENGGVDFKPYLNSTYGAHTLWLLGDAAHRSDFLGNVAWGFLMGSWGYSQATAHMGAGAQQFVHDVRHGGPLEGGPTTLFDAPSDYDAIRIGFGWWNGATLP